MDGAHAHAHAPAAAANPGRPAAVLGLSLTILVVPVRSLELILVLTIRSPPKLVPVVRPIVLDRGRRRGSRAIVPEVLASIAAAVEVTASFVAIVAPLLFMARACCRCLFLLKPSAPVGGAPSPGRHSNESRTFSTAIGYGHFVSGRVLQSDGLTPVAGVQVQLVIQGELFAQEIENRITDNQGRFSVSDVAVGIHPTRITRTYRATDATGNAGTGTFCQKNL